VVVMTVSTVDVLRAARDLYEQAPSHVPCGTRPVRGTYCVSTAIQASAGSALVISAFTSVIGTHRLATWNAEHSTEEVLAAFDRAIEAEQTKAVMA
jgi:hypothetical protein